MQQRTKGKGLLAKLAEDSVNGQLNPGLAGNTPPGTPPATPTPAGPTPQGTAPAPAPAAPAIPPVQPEPGANPPVAKSLIPERKLPGVEPTPAIPPVTPSAAFDEAAFDKETEEIGKGKEVPFKVFGDLRQELKKYRRGEVLPDPIKEKLTDLETKAARVAELELENEGLKGRVTKLASTSAKSMVQSHPVFEEKVERPRETIRETIKTIADLSDGKVTIEDLENVINETSMAAQSAALDKLTGKLPMLQLNRLVTCCNDLQTVREIERKMLDDAEGFLAEQNRLKAEKEESSRSEKSSTVKKYGQQFFRDYLQHIPTFLDEAGEMNDMGKKVARDLAAFNPAAMSLEDDGYAVFASAALAPLLTTLNEEREARLKLEQELARITNRQPSVKDGQQRLPAAQNPPQQGRKGLLSHMRDQNFVGA